MMTPTEVKYVEKLKLLIDFWEAIESHLTPAEWKVRKQLYDAIASLESELAEQDTKTDFIDETDNSPYEIKFNDRTYIRK